MRRLERRERSGGSKTTDVRKETEMANAKILVAAGDSSIPMNGNSGTSTHVPASPSTSTFGKNQLRKGQDIIDYHHHQQRRLPLLPARERHLLLLRPRIGLWLPFTSPTWKDTFFTLPKDALSLKQQLYVDDQGIDGKLLRETVKFGRWCTIRQACT